MINKLLPDGPTVQTYVPGRLFNFMCTMLASVVGVYDRHAVNCKTLSVMTPETDSHTYNLSLTPAIIEGKVLDSVT